MQLLLRSKLSCSIILFSLFFSVYENANAQSPDWQWAKRIGGTNFEQGYAIAVDASGNVYTTGTFYGTVDFDPGVGTYNLTTYGFYDMFISKLDSSGNFVWVNRMGGTSSDAYGYSIALDDSGHVYTTGVFDGTVDFNPGAGTFNLTSAGTYYDIFISKLDSSGNFVWAKRMGGTGNEGGYSMALDVSGNIYTTGVFDGIVDFDPGSGIFNLVPDSVGTYDIFISKLDHSGNFVWAKAMGGTAVDESSSLAIDASANIYTTGIFQGIADFDPGVGTFNLSSAGIYDIFISKLDSSGDFVWAKQLRGTSYKFGASIALDISYNIYTTGSFQGTVDFNPGVGTFNLTSAGSGDIFISKLDSSGNFAWAKAIGGTGNEGGNSLALDVSGNVYTTGSFIGTVDFDPDSTGSFNLTSAGNNDIFISKLNDSGNFVWAKATGGTNSDGGNSLALDASANVYMTGEFKSPSIIFGSTSLTNTNAGFPDIFIAKLATCITSAIVNPISCNSYTSPSGNYTWTTSGSYLDTIPNAAGCDSVITIHLTINNSTASSLTTAACYNYTSPSGNYIWTTSGTYHDTIPNVAGCDSVITIHLTINNSTASSLTTAACYNYTSPSGDYTWTTSGTYHDTIPNAAGCDSVITIQLTVNTVDTSLTQNGGILTANVAGAVYQWLNCNIGAAPVSGETNQAFTPSVSGNYAVTITQSGCTDTSACFTVTVVGLNEMGVRNSFELFPNPANSHFIIVLNTYNKIAELTITDITRKIIYTAIIETQKTEVSIPTIIGTGGVYIVQIQTSDFTEIKKLIVAK